MIQNTQLLLLQLHIFILVQAESKYNWAKLVKFILQKKFNGIKGMSGLETAFFIEHY